MEKDKSLNVFLSYASKDENYVEQFRSHLMSLNEKYKLKVFFDKDDIKFGDSIKKFIDDGLKKADVVFVFITPDYFASDWCQKELDIIIKGSDEGSQTLIPILLRDTYWQGTNISKYQILPRDIKPIQSLRNKDLAFKEIISEIDTVFHSIANEKENDNKFRFEITLNTDFEKFDEEKKKELIEKISKILNSEESFFKIINTKKGSVKLTIEVDNLDNLDEQKITLLKSAFGQEELASLNASNIEVSKEIVAKNDRRPKVFIGSSSEGLEIAETIQLNLDHSCEVTIWSQGVFGLGYGNLETLVQQISNYDFAILVLTPDDMIESRGDLKNSARDNVLFELGLFMGKLGRYRTFAVYDRTADIKIPSDLAGVSMATYHPHSSGNIDAALGASCTQMKRRIKEFGTIDKKNGG